MEVEIKKVKVNVSDLDLTFIVNDKNDPNTKGTTVLKKIKDWALKNGVKGDRYIGLTTLDICTAIKACGYAQFPYSYLHDTVIVQHLSSDPIITSHELGHTFGLCDEYSQSNWNWEDAEFKDHGLSGCPNPYPCLTTGCNCTGNTGEKTCLYGYCFNFSINPLPSCADHPNTQFACTPYFMDLFYYTGNESCKYSNEIKCFGQTQRCINPSYIRAPDDCTSSVCDKCDCNADTLKKWGDIDGSTWQSYPCATGSCSGSNFTCYGYKFDDDTYSVMGPAGVPIYKYGPDGGQINSVLCENHGFVALPPMEMYDGQSGDAIITYVGVKKYKYLKVGATIGKDGGATIDKVDISEKGLTMSVPKGDYSFVLRDEEDNSLYEKKFSVSFTVLSDPPELLNKTTVTFTLPYVDGAKSISLHLNNKEIANQDIGALINGKFETGDFTGWTASGPGDHKIDTQVPHTGNYSALIGFRDHSNVRNGYDHIYQTIEVPSNKETELSFNYRFYSYDYCNYDFFTLRIKDENGNVLATPVNRCLSGSGLKNTGWTEVKYDLTPYAGQKIQVYFEVSNRYDTWGKSWAYVDDVSVISQPINNGFETGDSTGWTTGGPGDHKIDTQVPHTGTYSALIGFRDHGNVRNGYDHTYQTITIPTDTPVILSFWYRFYTYDYCSYDFFTMRIKDVDGNILATPVNRCLSGGGLKDTGWTHVEYDLSEYAGERQAIQVYFEVSNRYDTWGKSWAYVDDVSIYKI